MARRFRTAETPAPEPKPWQRALAGVGTLGVVVLAGLILSGADANRTSWAKHAAGASALLFLLGGVLGAIAAPRLTVAIGAAAGWLLPVTLAWLGVEYWTNWHAFYTTDGRVKLTSENDARVAGSLVLLFALFAVSAWVFLVRGVIEDRRSGTNSTHSGRTTP